MQNEEQPTEANAGRTDSSGAAESHPGIEAPGAAIPTDETGTSADRPDETGIAADKTDVTSAQEFAATPAEPKDRPPEPASAENPAGVPAALFGDLDYATLRRRVWQIYVLLAIGGTIGAGAQGNRERAIGFLGGCAISGLSFFLLDRLVSDLGTALEGGKPRAISMLAHVFRLLLLGGATFAIVKLYGASRGALAAGLLVPVSAILLEAAYELIYARA
jgi:hypothetical protein